jgi:hypothetical protein
VRSFAFITSFIHFVAENSFSIRFRVCVCVWVKPDLIEKIKPELVALMEFLIFRFSIFEMGTTYGNKLQNLKFANQEWAPSILFSFFFSLLSFPSLSFFILKQKIAVWDHCRNLAKYFLEFFRLEANGSGLGSNRCRWFLPTQKRVCFAVQFFGEWWIFWRTFSCSPISSIFSSFFMTESIFFFFHFISFFCCGCGSFLHYFSLDMFLWLADC